MNGLALAAFIVSWLGLAAAWGSGWLAGREHQKRINRRILDQIPPRRSE